MVPVSSCRFKSGSLVKTVVFVLLLLWVLMENFSPTEGKLLPRNDRKNPVESIDYEDDFDRPHQLAVQRRNKLLRRRMRSGLETSMEVPMHQFSELFLKVPRYFNAFVVFYNDGESCEHCELAVSTLDLAAKAYSTSNHFPEKTEKATTLFVKIKYAPGFRDVVSVDPGFPSYFYFKYLEPEEEESIKTVNLDKMMKEEGAFSTVEILKWIQGASQLKFIKIKHAQPERISMLTVLCITLWGGITLCWISYRGYWDIIVECLQQINYSYGLTICILWLLSGQMFNYMRKTPMVGSGPAWELITYIYPGSRYQYGTESCVIMLTYGLIIYSLVHLIQVREEELEAAAGTRNNPEIENPRPRNAGMVEGLGGFLFGYVMLQFITQIKM